MSRSVEERRITEDEAVLVHFAPAIVLSKDEVFEACAVLASIERLLLAHGHTAEALCASDLVEDLEDRLAVQWPDGQLVSPAFSGSKSSERELTQ